jgi:PilZ domain
MPERRNFERVFIPESAGVYVATPAGERLGTVLMLGRGGFLLATRQNFVAGQDCDVVLVDEGQSIRTPVRATARYTTNQGVGFEFKDLSADAGVDVGVIIGKHEQGQG